MLRMAPPSPQARMQKVTFFMITRHQIYFQDSRNMAALASDSVDLVVTSPPYPMIEMWDAMFVDQNAEIGNALHKGDGPMAFELMHKQLDAVWQEVWRILKEGGIACLNVGDATRTINSRFMLYPNHSRILNQFLELAFRPCPRSYGASRPTLPINLWDPACCRPAPMSPWNMNTS